MVYRSYSTFFDLKNKNTCKYILQNCWAPYMGTKTNKKAMPNLLGVNGANLIKSVHFCV